MEQGSSYAIGNAAFHSGELYGELQAAISLLVTLLDDPVAKTRANASSTLTVDSVRTLLPM